ncbi:MAG: cell division protein FtsZ, partial [SAR202 cluster bacterium]|nr:cell division protein FtsZ [SAR202 cluster bacterium]
MSVGPDTRSSQPSLRHRLTEIRVIGVGVGGSNAVNHMFFTPMRDVHVSYAILNTDAAHLAMSAVPTRLTIGERLTRGLGAGGNPAIGRASAEESRDALRDLLRGADLVFIAAGMGGGTGTGGAPVVAQIAREVGALSIGIVTTPFAFGGRPRATVAERGLRE